MNRRPPIVLIIDDQEWSTRSLESILAPNGFAVMRAYTGKKGLERVAAHRPDLVIVDADLPDEDGYELCRTLRQLADVGNRTPILISCAERPTRQQRLTAFRSGAWDLITYPVDAEELVLKLDGYMRAKFEADQLQAGSLVDEATGLYNLQGLERRADEMTAWAYRQGAAMACVVIGPSVHPEAGETTKRMLVDGLAKALKLTGRVSDTIGRLGNTEFAILAPSTGIDGAVRLAERLAAAIRETTHNGVEVRGGFDAIDDARETPANARDLLMHATMALRKSRADGNGDWLRAFEPRNGAPAI